jgi:3-isopropylmalate dehydrogenase
MPTLLLLPGDGIGPEVTAQARRVAERVAPELTIETRLVGGASYDALGAPLSEETLRRATAADAVLLGAVGGPKWTGVARHLRPEAGILSLRAGMGVFANLRPALCFPALADASTLRREVVEGLDIMIVRELTGGVYFGQPRGIETLADGQRRGVDTRSTPPPRSSGWPAWPSTWRASGATGSPPARSPTSWRPAFCGARRSASCTLGSSPT